MRILCIGDSNTWGFDPADRTRQDRRWTRLLRTWLKEDEIIEEGCNGRTFAFEDPFTPGRCGLAALPTLLMSHDPIDLVIVMLGTNDLKVQFHANAAAIARGARSFVRTISDPNLYTYGVPSILIVSPILLHEKIEELEGPEILTGAASNNPAFLPPTSRPYANRMIFTFWTRPGMPVLPISMACIWKQIATKSWPAPSRRRSKK